MDTILIAVAGLLGGWIALFFIYLFMGVKYRKQANLLRLAIKITWKRIGVFVAAFAIGFFAYCLVLMLPGFIIYCFWYTFRGLPVGDENIHVLHWLYASVLVFSFITSLVITVKRTDLRNFLRQDSPDDWPVPRQPMFYMPPDPDPIKQAFAAAAIIGVALSLPFAVYHMVRHGFSDVILLFPFGGAMTTYVLLGFGLALHEVFLHVFPKKR